MTVLDTFYLLFKTDAGGAKNEVLQLDKQIDQLREKGKKRSEQENKELEEKIKRQKELKNEIKDGNQAAEKLMNNVAGAFAGYFSAAAIKNRITETAQMNRSLKDQASVLQVNTRELKTYAAALKELGANEGDLEGFVSSRAQEYQKMGKQYPGIAKDIAYMRSTIANASPAAQRKFLRENFGVPETMIQGVAPSITSDERLEAVVQAAAVRTAASEKDFEAAQKFGQSVDRFGQSVDALATSAGGKLLPSASKGLDWLTRGINKISGNPEGSALVAGGVAAAGTGRALMLAGIIPGLQFLMPIGIGLSAAGTGAAIGGAAGSLMKPSSSPKPVPTFKTGAGTSRQKTMDEDIAFFMSKGYSREQSAVMAATAFHESGTNALQWGDGGKAMGLIQWHPDRRANIMRGTGIDVTTADRQAQREALLWEMKNIRRNGWSDQKFRAMNDVGALSRYFTGTYVSPADAYGQSIARANTAISALSTFSGGASPTPNNQMSVKIEKIDVNTQATDAAGIAGAIGNELRNEIATARAQFDTGVNY